MISAGRHALPDHPRRARLCRQRRHGGRRPQEPAPLFRPGVAPPAGPGLLVGPVQRSVRGDALPRALRGRGGALRLLPQGLLRARGGVHGPRQDRAKGAAPRELPLLPDAAEALLGHKAPLPSPSKEVIRHIVTPSILALGDGLQQDARGIARLRGGLQRRETKRPRRRPRRPCPPTPADHPSTRARAPHLYARTCTP